MFDTFSPRPLNVGLLTPHNPYDRRKFSGTPFFATRALARHPGVRLRILGGHVPPRKMDRLLRRRAPTLTPETEVNLVGLDAVVGLVASPLLEALAQRAPDMPYLHVTDATPAFLRDAYGWNIPLSADATESYVAAHALGVAYSSQTMATRASGELNLPQSQSHAVPFGVNFENLPTTRPQKAPLPGLNLLFVGLDWVRKGGDIAVATLEQLRADGIEAHLTIVGTCPEEHRAHPAITYAGFLDKNRPAQAAHLAQLYRDAHFLLLPSRGDCTPMVIAEAMAHGTPVLATDTGGVASVLAETGCVMPLYSAPQDWAGALTACTLDYEAQAQAAFTRATQVLSWDRWADGISTLLHDSITLKDSTPQRSAA